MSQVIIPAGFEKFVLHSHIKRYEYMVIPEIT